MNDIKVIITQNKAAGLSGFGIPLILEGMADKEIPYTTCSDLDGVKKLFPEDTTVYKAAQTIFMQENCPAEIAVYASTEKAIAGLEKIFSMEWRQLFVASIGKESEEFGSENTTKEIAEYIEAKKDKLFFLNVSNTTDLTPLQTLERTIALYHPTDLKCPVCALVGVSAGKKPGSFTYKNQKLKGLEPVKLSDSEVKNIHGFGAITVLKKAGDIVSSEGMATNGEYIDIVDSRDYIIRDIEFRVQKLLNSSDKVPYDNNGIAMLESVVVNVLQEAYQNGMIAVNEKGLADFSVDFAKRSETLATDRAKRQYLGGKFKFGLAGAVHTVEIHGEIIV